MTEDPIPGAGQNPAFSGLLDVVRRLEWSGETGDGDAACPVCGATGPGGDHTATCDLKLALDAATSTDHWAWCHCDACECSNRVDPASNSNLCRDCARDLHFPDHEARDG